MAVKINFDSTHNVIEPTLVLATRNGSKIGKLPAYNIVFKEGLNTYSELSFRVNKVDCKKNNDFWNQITDFKLLWAKEWNKWFEIYVEVDETNDTVKNISSMSLGEAELSQINLYGIEINTETDVERDDYEPTVLYNSNNSNASLLTRIMEKTPHYTIGHVDATIANIQRTFTFDGKSLYDAFQEISQEINCLFVIDCYQSELKDIVRDIKVYDLESNCVDCGERGEFSNSCPKCGSKNILTGYGKDTTIFVSTDNLADDITYTTDTGSVKNCFRLEAGDDLMTATVINCNPNGSAYIWYIPEFAKKDMSMELANKIKEYDNDYIYYQNTYPIQISNTVLNKYNNLVTKYQAYSDKYSVIQSPIIGYSYLMEAYYNVIDFYLFLNDGLMPSVEISETTATKEAAKLKASTLSPVAVKKLSACSQATADSSVLSVAKTIINSRYQIKISESSFSNNTWTGIFTLTNYSNEEDTANSNQITITINDNYEKYVEQKINKALRQSTESEEITDIIQLFSSNVTIFKNELKKYCLSSLISFRDSCQSCIDVLTEQGIADNQTWANRNPNLYLSLYVPYYDKLGYIDSEIQLRENEIAIIAGSLDNDGTIIEKGIQTLLDEERDKIHNKLDFEKYIGEELWLEFSAYRREDTYTNDNYISDGLNNAELFENAREFIKTAQKEIFKSATLQHSISASLRNLLVMKEFEPIVNYFEVGNWIRIRVDNNIYLLRLLEYEIDFDNLNNIAITFSDVTTISNGISDIQSILDQASSMSSSYGSTKRQAKKGNNSKKILDNWVQKGLDATNVKIMSNSDNQYQSWDSHGMLFREYDSITDSYDACQLKIINSTIAITDNNWKSIKTAIGGFYYFEPTTGQLTYAYGVNAETIIGKIILGENLGIYSANNSLTFDQNGLVVTNGVNTFTVNPNSRFLLSLSNDAEDIFYVDDKGLLHISGDGAGLDISANDSINGLSSKIEQTASSITSTVAKAVSKYDTTDYSITLYGYTHPNSSEYKANSYNGKYYLNQTNGMLYKSSGTNWEYVTTLKLITSQLSSKIEQLPHSISLSVTNGSLGNTASIILDIDGTQTKKNLDLGNVRKAFADNKTAITIEGGTITFNSNTIAVNSGNFTLKPDGTITANNGNFSGDITSSKITGSSMITKNGNLSTTLNNGMLYGGYNVGDGYNGYVSFNSYYQGTGVYGTRIAGKGCVAIYTPYLGTGKYTDINENGVISIGQSGTLKVITDISDNGDGTIRWSWKTITFENGLMITAI